ncbi:CHAT domain-containing protein [Trichocoleus sp. FACHB-591]|uniref:CHAT domain-containing protein n=1 Tax=Trichocoleus sp. FACHB-591 TaxID=2692872 RepID=UPI0018EFAA45|nr:CHAT domain-containing protein [Trichocoleus sp. FACHB-591]
MDIALKESLRLKRMSKTYYTYRIKVANRERVEVEKSNPQHQSLGEPSGVFRYQERIAAAQPILEIARNNIENELNDSTQTRAIGEALFEILFDDVLRQDFVNFHFQVVQQEKQLLRVELDIDERGMPEIAALPWEFMCLPQKVNLGEIRFATDPSIVFSRRRSQWNPASPIKLKEGEKLRIALAISAPDSLPTVKYQPIQEALEKLANDQAIPIELLPIVGSANAEAINEILREEPHIFHFIGHGRLQNESNQEVGQIAFTDPDFEDEAMWVDADFFSGLFAQHRPGVVMLQACEGGMLSASQAFAGVASRVVQMNIPVVVAMQYEVSNSSASRFARKFYDRLAKGDPVDIAAQNGRQSIALGPTQFRKRDFATPVIFMRVQDGYLFQRPEDNPTAQTSSSTSASASNLVRGKVDVDEAKDVEAAGAEVDKLISGMVEGEVKVGKAEKAKLIGAKVGDVGGGSGEVKADLDIDEAKDVNAIGTQLGDV